MESATSSDKAGLSPITNDDWPDVQPAAMLASMKHHAISCFAQIGALAITRDGGTLYGANSGCNSIAIVDLATAKVTATIPVGRDPYGATLAPDEARLIGASKLDNTLAIVDLATRAVVKTIPGFNEPRQAIVFSKDGGTIYVLSKDLSIALVDVQKLELTRTLTPAP